MVKQIGKGGFGTAHIVQHKVGGGAGGWVRLP